jgi:hypothetical protein
MFPMTIATSPGSPTKTVVAPTVRSRFLHVANGTSVTMTLEAAGVPGIRSIWADPLHDGPVPGGLNDDELLEVRRRHLGGSSEANPVWSGEDPTMDPANDLRQWRATIAQHESFDELILWFEHDLFDQLNLIQLLTWIRGHLPATKPVSLVCIGSFPGRPAFKGLGELSPDELASLLDGRQPVTDAQYALAARAWHAFRQPTPEALDELRRGDTSAMPYLADAVARFLQEYPWTRDGLSRSERRLLELADSGGIALWRAFPLMGEGERSYYVTDLSLADLATELSTTSPPLLTLDLTGVPEGHALKGTVTVTDAGRSVLAGQMDRVATCGIDRWFGGVHLELVRRSLGEGGGVSSVWRWDVTSQRVTLG